MHYVRLIHGCLVASSFAALFATVTIPSLGDDPPAADEARIGELIGQLGADDFAVREKAQAELAQLGLEAFDALHLAQNDNDPEVALRARHLVRSMNVRWFLDSDSPDVQKILRGYGEQNDVERKSRIDRLASLDNREGTAALCRIARFETIDVLSKAAALKVMVQPEITDAAVREQLAKNINQIMGNSNRSPANWLRLYARTLADPASALAEWDETTQAEQATMAKHPEKTSREIVRDLFRWQVELLKRLGKDEEAVAVIRRTFGLLDGTPEQVKELVGWLTHAQRFDVVLEVSKRFAETFADSPELLYRLADAQQKLGKTADANATAERALAVKPDQLDEHLLVAVKLQDLGMHEWSQREFRHIIKGSPPGSINDFRSRFYLSELLHDQAKEADAADTLQPLCELMDKDEAAKQTCNRLNRDPESVYSRMHFFRALALAEQGNGAEAETRLDKAVTQDPTDADALIALFRLPNQSEARKEKTKKLVEQTAQQYRTQLEQYKTIAEQAPNEQIQNQANLSVALMCNQLAWLISNTTGDFDEAVRLSQRSLELRPDYPGYLDTLGRCYYAKGDLENAVKYQSQAVKLDPHSGQIRRQLDLFQKELAARGAKQE